MQGLIPLFVYADSAHHGHWWIVFPILWALLIAAAIAFFWRRRGRGDGDPARRILGERFARGEISADEYRERLAQLQ
jgi:putative membrane protein